MAIPGHKDSYKAPIPHSLFLKHKLLLPTISSYPLKLSTKKKWHPILDVLL